MERVVAGREGAWELGTKSDSATDRAGKKTKGRSNRLTGMASIANLLFITFVFLQFLAPGRQGESLWPVRLFIAVVETFYLLYLFFRKDSEGARTTGDLIAILYGLVLSWDLLTGRLNLLDKMLFPSPAAVLTLLAQELGEFFKNLVSSIEILSVGYGTAVAAGIGFGLIAGWKTRLRRIATPLSRILGPVPPTVYIPYAIVLLPTFKLASMFTIFIGAFWPVFINTFNGVLNIDGRIIDSARVLNLKQRTMLLKIILPGTMPSIMTGATIGLAMSFILLTAAEMIGATSGLGWYVKYFSDFADYPRVIVGIIFAGIVVTVIMYGFDKLERRLLKWRDR